MVIRDLKKTFWSEIRGKKFDILLLDLIDERFDMVRIGKSTVNLTGELDRSGYLNNTNYSRISRITYPSDIWNEECADFVNRLRKAIDTSKLIIIKPGYAKFFINKGGTVSRFDEKSRQTAHMWNSIMGGYYSELHRLLPEVPLICSDYDTANENHVWGLAPIHYIDRWYVDLKEKIIKQAEVMGQYGSTSQ